MLLSTLARAGTASFGSVVFSILTWLGLAGTLCAGLFFTADCLSEEKREGTLGFLFLTDLRGYDVVLGKLLATSLRGFYALLAALPVIGVTLLMGGITGGQFWKTSLALVHALFFSLAAGLVVSATSRDAQKALAGTFLLLLLLSAGGPVIDWLQSVLTGRSFLPRFSLVSPIYLFMAAGSWGRTSYWSGLALSQVTAWLALAVGSFVIPRAWQEGTNKSSHSRFARGYWWKYGGKRRREALRLGLLDINPALWLASRERWQGLGLWALAAVIVSGVVIVSITGYSAQLMFGWNALSGVLSLALYVWIASQACRFFVDARRSGLIELLLATPLEPKQIVLGHWRAVLRLFGLPVLLILLAQMISVSLATSWTAGTLPAGVPRLNHAVLIVSTGVSILTTVANLIALTWFGMWMGLTSRNTSLATLKTLVFVQVIPSFVVGFLASMLSILVIVRGLFTGGANPSQAMATRMTVWFPLLSTLMSALLNGGKDFGFFTWARKRLYFGFREEASRAQRSGVSSLSGSTIAPVVPPVATPPLILSKS
jgi:hypothetical protein